MRGSNLCCYVRGILDSGRQRTFVSQELSRKLKLEVIDEVDLCIRVFGHQSPSHTARRKIVKLALQSQFDGTLVEIEAIEIPHIRENIVEIPHDNDFVKKIESL
ncbi:hypothetical protein HPB49_008454 [Dermacentor silvarum]|uniref:Uncharacterized protein n=1 Tax=Dermacentor silvarum TaxID=543639 RepID=A0ACB8CK70_DERSI|nr:hypothetical protein HPB49_008454 [Dermacentor silvarum]